MTNKKLEMKRLLLFLFFAFAIAWIPAIILNKTIGYENWFAGPFAVFGLPLVYAPALANLLTRKITKEGMQNSLFHLRFKGHFKYYALAALIPLVQGILMAVTMTTVYGHWDFSEIAGRQSAAHIISTGLIVLAIGPLFAWNTFGEEFGWRAYMNQKMEPLLGTTGTVIVGGIIWGVWHAPLTIEGHNFGTDYPGYPYLGIICMCIFCIAEGAFLMWLTKKTGSVFPAAIMHACNNTGVTYLNTWLISGVGDPEAFEPTIPQQLVCMIPFAVCAAVCTVFMIRERKKTATASAAHVPAES
ncbi:MAG: CPBP family intramembrane metalloprotease [Oscillospiraceae bacterium]|nr:CPBP family intramembrane metalloprotease [Oscillospiraceae bacterium]